jgi:hypothetical protein
MWEGRRMSVWRAMGLLSASTTADVMAMVVLGIHMASTTTTVNTPTVMLSVSIPTLAMAIPTSIAQRIRSVKTALLDRNHSPNASHAMLLPRTLCASTPTLTTAKIRRRLLVLCRQTPRIFKTAVISHRQPSPPSRARLATLLARPLSTPTLTPGLIMATRLRSYFRILSSHPTPLSSKTDMLLRTRSRFLLSARIHSHLHLALASRRVCSPSNPLLRLSRPLRNLPPQLLIRRLPRSSLPHLLPLLRLLLHRQ